MTATWPPAQDFDGYWQQLVTVALLGTDRRAPPDAIGPIADMVADAVLPSPAERMLVAVASAVAVRRGAFVPLPPVATLTGPVADERPVCTPAAADRWRHLVSSWTALEDEWVLTLIERGWRVEPALVPAMLTRHRRDPVRWAHAVVAAGPLADWIVEQLPGLAPAASTRRVDRELIGVLPALPIPPELHELAARPDTEIGAALVDGLTGGSLGPAHRAVLVNLIARVRPGALGPIADRLEAVDPMLPVAGLAASLADLARTRHRMLDELSRP